MLGRDRWQRRLASTTAMFRNDEGQALIEYALVLALIAIASLFALQALGVDISFLLHRISSQMSTVNNP
jgi:Flp pilus assembly pilin Flp